MNSYQEEPVQFGLDSGLLGVITRPTGRTSDALACVMFNFGVTHRVGPRRIQVKMARRLAQEGFATLRFDLSGIGDSQGADAALSFEEQATNDLRAALDEIEKHLGIRQVVIFGLCSGVAPGLRMAAEDSRVIGLLSFDGYAFTSPVANFERRLRRLLRFPKAQISHWIERLLGHDRPEGDLLKTGERLKVVTPADFAREMDTLIKQGVSIYLIYSGSLQQRDRNHDQMYPLRGAPFLQKVRYEFMPKVDHSFTDIAGQQFFIDAACRWVEDIEAKRASVPSTGAPAANKLAPERKPSTLAVA
jgi:dienelactone hydrolase